MKIIWEDVKSYLKTIEARYAEIGSAGNLASTFVIRPIRDRFNKGERTEELYRDIMSLE